MAGTKASTPGDLPPHALPQGMDALTELAMDLRWTWNHCSDELWRQLDPEIWALTETEMKGTQQQGNGSGCYAYCATVSSARPATDYTARITMNRASLVHDQEAGWMIWQK